MNNANTLLSGLNSINPLWIFVIIAWTLVWKGISLWRAARLGQRNWFIALLIVNTLGLLEIIYIFWVSKNYKVETVEG